MTDPATAPRPFRAFLRQALAVAAGVFLAFLLIAIIANGVDRKRERALLGAVRAELVAHRKNLDSLTALQTRIVAAGDAFLAAKSLSADSGYRLIGTMMTTRPFQPGFTAYAGLLSSPDARLIKDVGLLTAITTYAVRFRDAADFQRTVANAQWDNVARPMLYDRLDMARMAGRSGPRGNGPFPLAADRQFRSLMLDRRMFANDVLNLSRKLSLASDTLLARLDQALGTPAPAGPPPAR